MQPKKDFYGWLVSALWAAACVYGFLFFWLFLQ